MSQPDQTTNIETTDERPASPPAGGAAALAAAAERKKRHVPTAKVAKRTPPASGAHGETPNPPPQQAQDEPNGRPEGKDTGDRSRGAYKPAQEPPPPPEVHQDKGTEPHGQSPDTGAGEEPRTGDGEQQDTSGGAIVQRPQPVSFNLGRLMAPKSSINPFEYESLKKDFESVTKRVINNVRILGEAIERFGYIVDKARKEGFPEDEIHRWAEQAGIEVPPAEPQR